MSMFQKTASAFVAVALFIPIIATAEPLDCAPFFSCGPDIDGNNRVRMLGPFFEQKKSDAEDYFAACRPFYSRIESEDRMLSEFLWPVAMHKHFKDECYWRALLAFGHDYGMSDPESSKRSSLFPFIFWGSDREQNPYFAVFPIGGTVRTFLGIQKVSFVLFPLYMSRESMGIESTDVLWPIFSYSRSDTVLRYRMFPVYGRSIHEGRFDKQFVFWPLWTSAQYETKRGPGYAYVLFPIFGRSGMPGQTVTWVVPPLFRWMESDVRREVNCPWPFFQYGSGNGSEHLYLWPLWGMRTCDEGEKSSFFLWPIVRWRAVDGASSSRRYFQVFPLLTVKRNTPTEESRETAAMEARVWPLFSHRSKGDSSMTRVPELWPLSDAGQVERNFAPFWSLYTHRKHLNTVEDELLWGFMNYTRSTDESGKSAFSLFPLFSWRKEEERSKFRFLLGFLGIDREGVDRRWQLLYFLRFGGKGEKE